MLVMSVVVEYCLSTKTGDMIFFSVLSFFISDVKPIVETALLCIIVDVVSCFIVSVLTESAACLITDGSCTTLANIIHT